MKYRIKDNIFNEQLDDNLHWDLNKQLDRQFASILQYNLRGKLRYQLTYLPLALDGDYNENF